MSLASLQIQQCLLSDVKEFVEHWHYSKSVKGLGGGIVYRVWRYLPITTQLLRQAGKVETVGAAIFGTPAMVQQVKKYSENGRFTVTELRRFVMIDDTPRCAEGYVLGEMLRRLRQQGVQRVLSYSDPSYGHNGVIYRGLGFQHLGMTPPTKIVWYKGEHYSHRSLNRCDGGKIGGIAKKLKRALASGTAKIQMEAGKYIYLKTLVLILMMLLGSLGHLPTSALAALARGATRVKHAIVRWSTTPARKVTRCERKPLPLGMG